MVNNVDQLSKLVWRAGKLCNKCTVNRKNRSILKKGWRMCTYSNSRLCFAISRR